MPTFRLLTPLLVVAVAGIAVAAWGASRNARVETGGGGLGLVEVVTGLERPTHVTVAPGEPGRLYVVEQAGRVLVVEDERVLAEPFLDITDRVGSEGNEQGLLSLAFHPDYRSNGLLYVDYTNRSGDTEIVELRAKDGRVDPGAARLLLQVDQPRANHNGGQLAFGPDGLLYVGMGDGGGQGDPDGNGQDLDILLGKLLRLDVADAQPEPELVAYGLRNPWRFSFDRETDDLWIADVGQSSREEIDVLPAGTPGFVNFGWNLFEGTEPYEDGEPNPEGELVGPVAEYSHGDGCSVTGGFVYRGTELPGLAGRYLYGDYCSGNVWSLALVPDGQADVRREPIAVPQLTSFGEDEAGELYLVSGQGSVYRLVR